MKEIDAKAFNVSAKTGDGVDEIFQYLAINLVKKDIDLKQNSVPQPRKRTVRKLKVDDT